jgi:hypothetical protein
LQEKLAAPIIIRAGKVRSKHLQQLQMKSGRIVEDVQEVMKLINSDRGVKKDRRVFVPVVVVYSPSDPDAA